MIRHFKPVGNNALNIKKRNHTDFYIDEQF